MKHKHKWRVLGQTDDIIVCDGCNTQFSVTELVNEAYDNGYAAGGITAGKLIAKRAKSLKPDDNHYDFRSLLIDNEIAVHDHGYYCAKEDILGGL